MIRPHDTIAQLLRSANTGDELYAVTRDAVDTLGRRDLIKVIAGIASLTSALLNDHPAVVGRVTTRDALITDYVAFLDDMARTLTGSDGQDEPCPPSSASPPPRATDA